MSQAGSFNAGGGGGGNITITGNTGGPLVSNSFTFSGGTTGLSFDGAGTTETLSITNLNLPTTNAALTQGVITLGGSRFIHGWDTNTGDSAYVGINAGNGTNTGDANCGFGRNTLTALTSGSGNNTIGVSSFIALQDGLHNNGVGFSVGNSLVSGSRNNLFGQQALLNCNGSNNIVIAPYQGGVNYNGTESNNIIIGGSDTNGATGDNNTIRIGESGAGSYQQNKTYIAGIFGSTVDVGTGIPAVIDSAGLMGTVVSSQRYKENISDIGDLSSKIYDLRPVIFNYKKYPGNDAYGLIAEEVANTFPEIVVKDNEGNPETVRYLDLIPMLINEIKKLKEEIEFLKG